MARVAKDDPFRLADRKLRKLDPKLATVIDAVGPVRIELNPRETVYQSLFKSILYQQLTGKAAATILGRVKALYPGRFPKPDDFLKTPGAVIRKAGVSGAKLLALQDLSRRQLAGLIPSRSKLVAMEDEEIIDLLTETRGIGRWTVHMFLIFTLGRTERPTGRRLRRAKRLLACLRWRAACSASTTRLWRKMASAAYRGRLVPLARA